MARANPVTASVDLRARKRIPSPRQAGAADGVPATRSRLGQADRTTGCSHGRLLPAAKPIKQLVRRASHASAPLALAGVRGQHPCRVTGAGEAEVTVPRRRAAGLGIAWIVEEQRPQDRRPGAATLGEPRLFAGVLHW